MKPPREQGQQVAAIEDLLAQRRRRRNDKDRPDFFDARPGDEQVNQFGLLGPPAETFQEQDDAQDRE